MLPKVESLDQLLALTNPMGSIRKAATNTLYGIDIGTGSPIRTITPDEQGYVFFTRPQLRLTNDNLRNDVELYSFLTQNKLSAHAYVRSMLDPRLARPKRELGSDYICPLVDDYNAFIPILSNSITSLSGWPDVNVGTFTSREGLMGEQISFVDGHDKVYGTYDLSASFMNPPDEILTLLFKLWARYTTNVYQGLFMPYPDFIAEQEIDYNTRIYRLVMDKSKRFVKKIFACGAAFPNNLPIGKHADYNRDNVYNDVTSELQINFRCMGFLPMQDKLIEEFNTVVGYFNPAMRTRYSRQGLPLGPTSLMAKVPPMYHTHTNYRMYPYINENTLELEWYMRKDSSLYKFLEPSFDKANQ